MTDKGDHREREIPVIADRGIRIGSTPATDPLEGAHQIVERRLGTLKHL